MTQRCLFPTTGPSCTDSTHNGWAEHSPLTFSSP